MKLNIRRLCEAGILLMGLFTIGGCAGRILREPSKKEGSYSDAQVLQRIDKTELQGGKVSSGGLTDEELIGTYSEAEERETARGGAEREDRAMDERVILSDGEDARKYFTADVISDEIYGRMEGKSYPKDCPLAVSELRYLTVLHYGFDGSIHRGELIVNREIAEETLEVFWELFEIRYPIEKLRLIDEYDADDERSMADNNSSGFNYRFIAETETLSNHALGRAIDINPLYNPYVYTRDDGSRFLQPANAEPFLDRSDDHPYYIKKGDQCYEIFRRHGFSWGGDWEPVKDYQHFQCLTEE